MSSDPQAHISSQQAIAQPAVSSRPASKSGHAATSSATAADPPQPAVTALSATSSGPHPDHAESAVQPQLTPSGVTTSFNKPVPSPSVPQITTVSLPMSVPRPGYHSGEEHQQSESFTSSPHPIISSSAHTLGSSEAAVMGGDTPSAQSTTSILIPAPAGQAHPPAATVSTSAPPPGPVTATPILPSSSSSSIVASGPVQSHFHASGPGTAGSAFAGPSRKSTQESIQESASEHHDERTDGNALAQVHAPAHGYTPASAPVAGPSGQTNAVPQTQSQRTPTPQELPSSGLAHPRGPGMHMSMGDNGNGAGIGAGYASGPTNGHNASALGNKEGQRRQNSSPGLRTSTRTVSYTDAPLPSRAVDRYPMPMTNPNQPVPTASVAKTLPLPPPAHHGSGGDLVMSPQAGAPMSPHSDLDWTVPYMSGSHPAGHGNGMGMQGMPGGMGATGGRPGSRHESRRGSAYMGNGNGGGNGNASAHRRSMSMAPTLVTGSGERSVAERLQPTLEAAERELVSARRIARVHGWALNAAIGAQVVFGALTTGVAAATTGRQTSIATSILGGLSTLAASYLAKARGSGEPEASSLRARELESFVRDLQAFMLDHGHLTMGVAGAQSEPEAMVARYRRRFEEIMGNALQGVEDALMAEKQMQEMKTAVAEKRKADKSMA